MKAEDDLDYCGDFVGLVCSAEVHAREQVIMQQSQGLTVEAADTERGIQGRVGEKREAGVKQED